MISTLTGVYNITPTPFHDDGTIDHASLRRLTAFTRDKGVDGMTILGIMGEAPKLDTEEAIQFSRRVIRRCGGLPVIVGVSAPGFAAMRALARSVMDAGAAGVIRPRCGSLESVVLPVPDRPKKSATSPDFPTFAEQCIGSTPRFGSM